jgi:hypothetical protein
VLVGYRGVAERVGTGLLMGILVLLLGLVVAGGGVGQVGYDG